MLVLTLTPSPAFTAVAGPEPITVAAFETLSGYLDNMATEYPQLGRMHAQLTQVCATRGRTTATLSMALGPRFAAMEIRYPEQYSLGWSKGYAVTQLVAHSKSARRDLLHHASL
ncbi:MAG: hypothetical protein IPH12_18655 [Saprospirales bacterium]|nr:hypothetical protein [Saprospirales bacterium]